MNSGSCAPVENPRPKVINLKKHLYLGLLALRLAAATCAAQPTNPPAAGNLSTNATNSVNPSNPNQTMTFPFQRTDEEWRKTLTPEQYQVLREAGTERPFTGKYWNMKEPGVYRCAACGAVLFTSRDKFDSGCGWPSFSDLAAKGVVVERSDTSHGMRRTEVLCANCGSHLGHVFDDGPTPTGLRYCINSVSIDFSLGTQTNKTEK